MTALGFEGALIDELGRGAGPGTARPTVLRPGVVVHEAGTEKLAATDHAFARQILPRATRLEAPSIAKLADAVAYALVPILAASEAPWRLDVITPDPSDDAAVLERRAELVRAAILEALTERRKKVVRRMDPAARWAAQVLLVDREVVFLSSAEPITLPGGATWPSPLPGGVAAIEDDWDAPSSAFRKLREALIWLESPIEPGHRCVDLGASPGGWTHVALAAGAQVTALDRAELDPRLMRNPLLTHYTGDAFAFTPPNAPVDWLLSDVITTPERAIELLQRWTRDRLCKRFVVHLKFKGDDQYGLVQDALGVVRRHGFRGARAKKLVHDKNEVTIMSG